MQKLIDKMSILIYNILDGMRILISKHNITPKRRTKRK